MVELKTLLDLELYPFAQTGHPCPVCCVSDGCICEGVEINNLKKVLQKWIEELRKLEPITNRNYEKDIRKVYPESITKIKLIDSIGESYPDSFVEVIRFLEHFFNLEDKKRGDNFEME